MKRILRKRAMMRAYQTHKWVQSKKIVSHHPIFHAFKQSNWDFPPLIVFPLQLNLTPTLASLFSLKPSLIFIRKRESIAALKTQISASRPNNFRQRRASIQISLQVWVWMRAVSTPLCLKTPVQILTCLRSRVSLMSRTGGVQARGALY